MSRKLVTVAMTPVPGDAAVDVSIVQGVVDWPRLFEAGVRFVSVYDGSRNGIDNWDTHANGHTTLVDMKKQIDGLETMGEQIGMLT